MFFLSRLSRFSTQNLRSPHRARLVYIAMALAFAALAVAGAVRGDALVAVIAAIVAAGAIGLAAIAPRLSAWTRPPEDVR